ncbi:TPA: SGNH/GDSL hydrolase family protein [Escherichia coli]|nr:SGNH/GDSL hydrolase family protein [Escherichia coli]HCG2937314.1 SGNH/GDSL hydrolase family protein [Escherichia coli]HCG3100422.1 SGNH/GDSL hydrolase family protein [Escherichia coli]
MKPLIPPINSPDNLFHDGNPVTGALGTIVTADWLNDVQDATRGVQFELLYILQEAGIDPDKATTTQVHSALKKLFLSRSNPFADIKADGVDAVAAALENLGLPCVIAEAYSGADDTAILQAAVNDAISKKALYVLFNRDYNVTGTIWNRQEVIFKGGYSITGAGAYRMRIVKGSEASMPVLFNSTKGKLPKLSSKSSPVVVVVGDSISTYQPNTIDKVSSQYQCIIDKIKRDNPGKTPVFYNRAIGGQLFKDLDAIPTGFVDWYTDHNKPWLDYVSELNPDLVFVNMGMNDSSGISIAAVNSVINKIKAFPSKPDIVMSTCMVPSTNGGGSNNTAYGSKSAQEGRDYAAGLIRAACVRNNIPCVDVNRVFNVMRDGFDVLDSYNVRMSGATVTNGAFVSQIEARNWSAKFSLPDRASYNANNTPLSVRVGSKNNEAVFIQVHTDNTLKLTLWNATGGTNVYVSSQVIPDSPHQITVEVYNQKIRVYLSGTSTDTLPAWVNLYVGGGLYFPAIGGYENNYSVGGLNSIDEFNYGEHVKYLPALTNTQVWGVGDGTAGTKLPYGGNGINHPTTMGISVFEKAYDSCDFSFSDGIFSHEQSGGYEVKNGRIIRIWGLIKPSDLIEQVDLRITWPVPVSSGALVFTASPGVLSQSLTATNRTAKTILTCGLPDFNGVDVTFHNLNLPLAGRYAAWELLIVH